MTLELMNALMPLSDDEKIELLGAALNQINNTIFAIGAPLGSDRYFEIRKECVDTLNICGIPLEDVA